MSFLSVQHIHKNISPSFSLTGISFEQDARQKIAITGETGSGKSTLLKIIAGLLQADAGNVYLQGERIMGPEEQLIPGHPRIAYLSQAHELRNNYRIEELLEYANRLPAKEAEALYRLCKVDHLMKRKNVQLSGGEKQRVALTRLLTGAPSLLLLDEPFSNLDPIHKQLLKSVISDISTQLNITCILTSHDPLDTLSWADQVIILRNGQLLQQDTPARLFHHPVNEYAAGLFGPYNLLNVGQAIQLGISIPPGQQLFIRPNGFVWSEDGFTATIKESRFYGNYHYLTVTVNDTELVLILGRNPYIPGDNIQLKATEYTVLQAPQE